MARRKILRKKVLQLFNSKIKFMIKAVIFDYGGVMKESHPLSMDIAKIFGVSVEKAKMAEIKIAEAGRMAARGVIEDDQLFEKISEILGKPLPEKCVDIAQKLYRDSFVFFSEMENLVKELRSCGLKTAVLSNISKFEADVTRDKEGYDRFDVVVLSYEVGIRKPEPEIYALTAKKLNLSPEECIFTDDAEKNLMPAEKLGMKTVLFKNPKQAVKDVLVIIKKLNKK